MYGGAIQDFTQYTFVFLLVVANAAIAIALIRTYRRTRNMGFVWLAVAVVVWPLVSNLSTIGVNSFVDHANQHRTGLGFPFTLVDRGQMTMSDLVYLVRLAVQIEQLVGIGILLVAVIYLCKPKTNTNVQATA